MKGVENPNSVKKLYGIPDHLWSCHTAFIDEYFIEGHVPAEDIFRLLKEKPDVKGLVVPGMPIGSPGMEGGTPEKYEVLTLDKFGKTAVFSRH